MENKKRLVDANTLLHEYCQANGCNEVNDEICPNCFTAGLIANAPTVDAVEVVRCWECKHRDGIPGQPNIVCWQMHDDDFCSYGEPKDGD